MGEEETGMLYEFPEPITFGCCTREDCRVILFVLDDPADVGPDYVATCPTCLEAGVVVKDKRLFQLAQP